MAVIVFAIGASFGSFLNVVADRLPAGQSLVSPASRCDVCGHPLSKLDNIPIVSFLWLRGICRYCEARIPARVLVVEVITALLFTAVYLKFGFGVEFVAVSATMLLLLAVAVIDWEHKLILNRVVFPGIVVALVVAPFWNELGLERSFLGSSTLTGSFLNSFVAGIGAFLVFLLIVLVFPQGMGGGDVKYAGLLGLLVGFPGVLVAWWISAVLGGMVAIFLLVVRKKSRKDAIPYGPFMSLGGIVVLLAGSEIVAGYRDLIDAIAGV